MTKMMDNIRGQTTCDKTAGNRPVVCLVHGLWMTGMEMSLLNKRLVKAGFHVVRFSYPSISKDVVENARRLRHFLASLADPPTFFVCHSYGGLVVCMYLNRFYTGPGTKVVFLGTPLNSSSLAKRLGHLKIVRIVAGKSLSALKRGCMSAPRGTRCAMIAGTVNIGLGMFFLKGEADGMVAVSDTQAPWLDSHAVVRSSHLALLFSKKASNLCVEFLSH